MAIVNASGRGRRAARPINNPSRPPDKKQIGSCLLMTNGMGKLSSHLGLSSAPPPHCSQCLYFTISTYPLRCWTKISLVSTVLQPVKLIKITIKYDDRVEIGCIGEIVKCMFNDVNGQAVRIALFFYFLSHPFYCNVFTVAIPTQ